MGVVVPAGRHRVVLSYRPRSLLLGALVSLTGGVALAASMRGHGARSARRTGHRDGVV
jgi:uncharacterized membrane protein YfhO